MRFRPGQMMYRPAWLAVLVVAAGCATFDPEPLDQVPFRERAQTETQGDVTVSAVVLTAAETRRAFDVLMQRKKIQPVYLRIQNDTDHDYLFLAADLDPEYFSPHETSWKNHFFLGGLENKKMDDYMYDEEIHLNIPPRSTVEGFIYTNRDYGVKVVSVRLLADHELKEFTFILEIPASRPTTSRSTSRTSTRKGRSWRSTSWGFATRSRSCPAACWGVTGRRQVTPSTSPSSGIRSTSSPPSSTAVGI